MCGKTAGSASREQIGLPGESLRAAQFMCTKCDLASFVLTSCPLLFSLSANFVPVEMKLQSRAAGFSWTMEDWFPVIPPVIYLIPYSHWPRGGSSQTLADSFTHTHPLSSIYIGTHSGLFLFSHIFRQQELIISFSRHGIMAGNQIFTSQRKITTVCFCRFNKADFISQALQTSHLITFWF